MTHNNPLVKQKIKPTELVIKYPSGAKQVVKPNMEFFQGDWYTLAYSVGAAYSPRNEKGEPVINYELR